MRVAPIVKVVQAPRGGRMESRPRARAEGRVVARLLGARHRAPDRGGPRQREVLVSARASPAAARQHRQCGDRCAQGDADGRGVLSAPAGARATGIQPDLAVSAVPDDGAMHAVTRGACRARRRGLPGASRIIGRCWGALSPSESAPRWARGCAGACRPGSIRAFRIFRSERSRRTSSAATSSVFAVAFLAARQDLPAGSAPVRDHRIPGRPHDVLHVLVRGHAAAAARGVLDGRRPRARPSRRLARADGRRDRHVSRARRVSVPLPSTRGRFLAARRVR